MADADDQTFSLEEGISVQREMRAALGLGPEQFPLPAFVGMISDEIEQLRAAGRTDADIADMIKCVTGKTITAEAIALHYATPDQRHGGS